MWSDAAFSVWGKLDRDSNLWMRLVIHLEDAHAVAGLLWEEFLPLSIKQFLCDALHLSDPEAKALVCWYAGIHDVGKAAPAFAYKAQGAGAPWVLDHMRDAGLAVPLTSTRIGHATIGQIALRDWLMSKYGIPRRIANTWSCVVGGHHGRNPTPSDITGADNSPSEVGVDAWVDVRTEILDTIAQRTGPELNLAEWTRTRLPVPAQVLLTAIVVMADWIASNQQLFPYLDHSESTERACVAYEKLGLPRPWAPVLPEDAVSLFRQRFPALGNARPRPIQQALFDSALTCGAGSLHIVEEAMGAGKTEAAFLAAEALCARFGQGGLFIGLPTMATANPMFERTLEWLITAVGTEDASVALAHGKAGLNESYADLTHQSRYGPVHDDDGDDRGHAVVNGWLRGRRKAGWSSMVIGTIDQGLFVGLKAKHVALRHLAMAGKVVVIDEVHAADTYMREYLKRVLTWLGAYRTPVILMSATLPPEQRDEYVEAYAVGRGDPRPPLTNRADIYPRITRFDGQLADVSIPRASTSPTRIEVHHLGDAPAELADLLQALLAGGGCAGVICNTVRRAQETYQVLRDHFGTDVVLMHSRFLAPHRAAKETELVAQLGRAGVRPERLIVVGTQVLEQSLDIDFDVMITDLAPVDLVLQRAGRLHRHAGRRRPARVTVPTLYLRGVEDWHVEPPVAVRGSRSVYGEALLLRAAAVLHGLEEIEIPAIIPSLVRRAYDPALEAPVGWDSRWTAAEEAALRKHAATRDRAQTYLLAEPGHPVNLTGWLDVNAGDPELDERKGRSQVRDSEDSLEVIALWRDQSGDLRIPPCARDHAGAVVPEGHPWGVTGTELSIARAMASCTLSLPVQFTHDGIIEKVISELEQTVNASGWQKSPWVSGQLVLVFDTEDRASLAGYDLRYSNDEGLLVAQAEESP